MQFHTIKSEKAGCNCEEPSSDGGAKFEQLNSDCFTVSNGENSNRND